MNQDHEQMLDYLFGSLPSKEVDELEDQWHTANMANRAILEVVDELANAVVPMEPNPEVKKQLLESIQPHARFKGFIARLCQLFDLPSASIEMLLQLAREAPKGPWETMQDIDGISLLHLKGGPLRANADCGLVYIKPGAQFPCHRHLGDEYSLILQGEVLEDNTDVRRAGDQVWRPANSQHTIRAIGSIPVIAAVVLNIGLEFVDLLPGHK